MYVYISCISKALSGVLVLFIRTKKRRFKHTLTVDVEKVRTRLSDAKSVLKLGEKNRQRIHSLMNAINYYESRTEEIAGYTVRVKTRDLLVKCARIGERYYRLCINWMEENELIQYRTMRRRRIPILSETGRETLIQLSKIYQRVELSSLNYDIFSNNTAVVKVKGDFRNGESLILAPYIHEALNSLLPSLAYASLNGEISLELTIPRTVIQPEVREFLAISQIEFFNMIGKTSPPVPLPNDPWEDQALRHYRTLSDGGFDPRNLYPVLEEELLDWDSLDIGWKKTADWDKIGETWETGAVAQAREMISDGVSILTDRFHELALSNTNVRDWLESVLKINPDWLLPHIVWVVSFGFKQSRSLNDWRKVSPPYYVSLQSPQTIKKIQALRAIFQDFKRRVPTTDDREALIFLAEVISEFQEDPEFYESWQMIRHEYQEPWWRARLSRYIDAAYLRFIADEKPRVDLRSAFIDIAESNITEASAEEEIRMGGYKLKI